VAPVTHNLLLEASPSAELTAHPISGHYVTELAGGGGELEHAGDAVLDLDGEELVLEASSDFIGAALSL
jgi:hypothetical protein